MGLDTSLYDAPLVEEACTEAKRMRRPEEGKFIVVVSDVPDEVAHTSRVVARDTLTGLCLIGQEPLSPH